LVALHNSRNPFSGEVALQGNRRKHPAFANLPARQRAGLGFQAHRFGMRAEQRGGLFEVHGAHRAISRA